MIKGINTAGQAPAPIHRCRGMTSLRSSIKVFFICLVFSCFVSACKNETAWKPGTPLRTEKIKIGVIHSNALDSDSLYDYAHYMGIDEMQRNLGLKDSQIIRKYNVFEADQVAAQAAMRDCIAEGANVIIATSFRYMEICEELAEVFPSVIFVHAMGYKYNDRNFTNYSMRLYHARYLSGIVAGLQTKTGKIGYVAAMGNDSSEVTGGINAFAIGVEEVNPEASVYVQITYNWYDPMGEANAANALIAAECDVIAAHCDTPAPQIAAQSAGVWGIGYNIDTSAYAPDAVITSVVLNWGAYYTMLVESIIDGTFTTEPHFYGIAEGVVDITPPNEKITEPGIKAALETARRRFKDGFNVFDGPLHTNTGNIIGEEGKTLSDEIILGNIDWYYRNVMVMK